MASLGPFPGWLAAVMIMMTITYAIEQVAGPTDAYWFALIILLSVLVMRPNAITAITTTFGSFLTAGGSSSTLPPASGTPQPGYQT